MHSQLKPFEDIIQAVKDGTGIKNLRNIYPQIRRFAYRSESDIGYGGGVILKRVIFSTEDGSIVNNRIRIPEDFISVEAIGMCKEGICPGDYKFQGNFLILCKPVQKFNFVYYSMICDGEGNPAVTENHFEAVVAGILWRMYQPKVWNNEGNANYLKYLETEYENRCGEARGSDVFPDTKEEWSSIATLMKMSQRDIMLYDFHDNCYCCVGASITQDPPPPLPEPDAPVEQVVNTVYYWQYSDLSTNITEAPNIDQVYLDTQNNQNISAFRNGYVVGYQAIGRIGFAVSNVSENSVIIRDLFDNDITAAVFDTYYNQELETQIFISKEYYSFGNILFKITKN